MLASAHREETRVPTPVPARPHECEHPRLAALSRTPVRPLNFARPEMLRVLESEGIGYTIRFPATDVLHRRSVICRAPRPATESCECLQWIDPYDDVMRPTHQAGPRSMASPEDSFWQRAISETEVIFSSIVLVILTASLGALAAHYPYYPCCYH